MYALMIGVDEPYYQERLTSSKFKKAFSTMADAEMEEILQDIRED
jgi:hypothetical protein